MWNATVLSLFPEMFPGTLAFSIAGKALVNNLWSLNTINIRDFSNDKNGKVDDVPFGGGHGMVLKPEVLDRALKSVVDHNGPRIYLSPRGRKFDQSFAKDLSKEKGVVFICGRYEGVDERFLTHNDIQEVSVGDYVLSGGEIGAQLIMDATIRLLPNVIGNSQGLVEESFEGDLLEYPLYTQPRVWNGIEVPEVLLSGDHKKIEIWKIKMSEKITKLKRPDLWSKYIKS
ncbi:MAG: tRNA (guanosine(37)-N1)-methyltransferase TrmD [Alphaproteobacteria bacterium]|nr:tRNA (guanosine(37)-N1)-methyltransferase TrmD [Alphaproteobacteria bacterium]MDG2458256.1 tRNA (guanosine(37)-N1)-methyltransferase TrmD [Alphaproteobacteria bacterium]